MTITCLTFAHKTCLNVKMPYHKKIKKTNILPDSILLLQAACTKQLGVICMFIETKCSAQSAEMMVWHETVHDFVGFFCLKNTNEDYL